MHSQNDEERLILDYLGDRAPGNFLDIGAYDGKSLSNTHALALKGWGGVCVEPSPEPFTALRRLYLDRPDITLVHAPITPVGSSLLTFYDSQGDAVSTLDPDHVRKWEAGSDVKFSKYFVQSVSVRGLLLEVGTNFQVLSLDVESTNWAIFEELLPRIAANLLVLSVEHDGEFDRMAEFAAEYGFTKFLGHNAENIVLGHELRSR